MKVNYNQMFATIVKKGRCRLRDRNIEREVVTRFIVLLNNVPLIKRNTL